MADFSKYVHYACGLINFDKKSMEDKADLLSAFVNFCESYSKITKYYLVFHDDGENHVPHIHFIFYSVSSVQVMTYYNKLRNWFVPKYTRDEYGINIEKCKSFNAHLRYIIHQDAQSIKDNKKRYEIEDIISDDDSDTIDMFLHSKKGAIDAYYLRNCILDSGNDFELMVRLTLPVFHRYGREIQTLKEMRPLLVQMRNDEKKEKLDNELPF